MGIWSIFYKVSSSLGKVLSGLGLGSIMNFLHPAAAGPTQASSREETKDAFLFNMLFSLILSALVYFCCCKPKFFSKRRRK